MQHFNFMIKWTLCLGFAILMYEFFQYLWSL